MVDPWGTLVLKCVREGAWEKHQEGRSRKTNKKVVPQKKEDGMCKKKKTDINVKY